MSLNQLILDEPKPWLDIRVNNIAIDGEISFEGDHPIISGNLIQAYLYTTDGVYPNDVTVFFRSIAGLCNMVITLPTEIAGAGEYVFTPPVDFPDRFKPTQNTNLYVSVDDSGTYKPGIIELDTDGIITVSVQGVAGKIGFQAGPSFVDRYCLSYISGTI